MSFNNDNKQKSPKRRFLFLGVIRLVCVAVVGLMIMFWSKIDFASETEKLVIGGLFIVYGVVRFVLSLKNQPDE